MTLSDRKHFQNFEKNPKTGQCLAGQCFADYCIKNIGRYEIQRFVDLMNKAPSYIIFQKDSPFCENVHFQSLFIFRNTSGFLLIFLENGETEYNKIHY